VTIHCRSELSSLRIVSNDDRVDEPSGIIILFEIFLFINPLKSEILVNAVYKNSVRTSQETHYVSATKTNRLMLFTVRTIWNT
jgi:hypothetical protein